jgi:hypothetical protein
MTSTQTVMLPTGAPATAAMGLAERPQALKGLRVGLLDNGKEFSDQVLEALAEALRRDHGVTSIKFWRKGFPAKGAPFIAEMAAETDVAISGVGHCGSSSPWSVIDAANLEKGHGNLAIVMLPHPIGEADQARIAQKGTDAAAECVRLLTTPGEAVGKEFAAKKFPLPEHAVARN